MKSSDPAPAKPLEDKKGPEARKSVEKSAKAAANSPAKVFDVRRPGKAPASPTSRPVIVGHKQEAQEAQTAVSGIGEARPLLTRRTIQVVPTEAEEDPTSTQPAEEVASGEAQPIVQPTFQVVQPATQPSQHEGEGSGSSLQHKMVGPSSDPAYDRSPLAARPERKIEPLQSTEPQPEPASKPEESAPPDAPATSTTAPAPAPETVVPVQQSSVPDEAPIAPTSPAIDASSKSAPDGEDSLLLETTPDPVIEPLFDDSGMIVSTHNHHPHHGLKVAILLVAILALAVLGLDVLLDMGILNLPNVPHTNLFNS